MNVTQEMNFTQEFLEIGNINRYCGDADTQTCVCCVSRPLTSASFSHWVLLMGPRRIYYRTFVEGTRRNPTMLPGRMAE